MNLDSQTEQDATMDAAAAESPATRAFSHLIGDLANLRIHDFDIHERTYLDTYDRTMPSYVMSYMKEGSSTVRYNNKDYVAQEGEVIILPPRIRHDHHMGGSRHTIFLWWHFDLTIGENLDVLRFIREPVVFPVENRRAFERQFLRYADLNSRQHSTLSQHLLCRAKALELLAYLLENAFILNYINDRFCDVPDDFISMLYDIVNDPAKYRRVNELGKRYGYHPTHVTSRFRHFFGVTPSKLGRDLLYKKALLLIRARDISMEDVAFELGFSEPSSFTRFFKSVEGLSPSSVRKQSWESE